MGPCVWLSPANRYVVTRWGDVSALDENPALTAAEPDSLMTRAMGLSMLRTDGETHQRQRVPAHRGLRAIEFRSRWGGMLDHVADDLLDGLEGDSGAELVSAFAGPYAAAKVERLVGLTLDELVAQSPALDEEFYRLLGDGAWLETKVSEGGTALARVRALKRLLGLDDVANPDMETWSQAR